MASLSLTIPGVPVPKGRARATSFGGHARLYTPSKTRRYEDLIRLEAGRAMEGRAQLAGPLSVAPGQTASWETRLYAGPKAQDNLDDVAPGLRLTLDYGIFTVIAQPLAWLLDWLHALTGNWGWAIVLLVVIIKALLDAFGADRTVWGTGYPGHHRTKHNWLPLADEIRLIREGLPFVTPRDAEKILGETAVALWRL